MPFTRQSALSRCLLMMRTTAVGEERISDATAAPIPPPLIAAIAERSSASPAVRPRTGLRIAGDVCVVFHRESEYCQLGRLALMQFAWGTEKNWQCS